jgi:hypothetical protein
MILKPLLTNTLSNIFNNSYLLLLPKSSKDLGSYVQGTYKSWNLLNHEIVSLSLKQILKYILLTKKKKGRILFIMDKLPLSKFEGIINRSKNYHISSIHKGLRGIQRGLPVSCIIFIGKVSDQTFTSSLMGLKIPILVISPSIPNVADYKTILQTEFFSAYLFIKILLKKYLARTKPPISTKKVTLNVLKKEKKDNNKTNKKNDTDITNKKENTKKTKPSLNQKNNYGKKTKKV